MLCWWLLELLSLFIIDLREASGKGLWVLWDNTTMIMSDLQPSNVLVMTLHDFLPSLTSSPRPSLFYLTRLLLYIYHFLFLCVCVYFFFFNEARFETSIIEA